MGNDKNDDNWRNKYIARRLDATRYAIAATSSGQKERNASATRHLVQQELGGPPTFENVLNLALKRLYQKALDDKRRPDAYTHEQWELHNAAKTKVCDEVRKICEELGFHKYKFEKELTGSTEDMGLMIYGD